MAQFIIYIYVPFVAREKFTSNTAGSSRKDEIVYFFGRQIIFVAFVEVLEGYIFTRNLGIQRRKHKGIKSKYKTEIGGNY